MGCLPVEFAGKHFIHNINGSSQGSERLGKEKKIKAQKVYIKK